MKVWDQFSQATFLALVVISSIALMVGGIGVMAIMMISVTERTREIGVRKALGARRREILWQFLIEAAFLTSFGGVLGIVFGSGIGLLIHWISRFPISLPVVVVRHRRSASRPASASSSASSPPSRPRAWIRSKRCATSSFQLPAPSFQLPASSSARQLPWLSGQLQEAAMQDFRKLVVWQKAHTVGAGRVRRFCQRTCATRTPGRCAIRCARPRFRSRRISRKEPAAAAIRTFGGFLLHSLGSANELEYDLLLARDLGLRARAAPRPAGSRDRGGPTHAVRPGRSAERDSRLRAGGW